MHNVAPSIQVRKVLTHQVQVQYTVHQNTWGNLNFKMFLETAIHFITP